jgi:excinuclease ABC subunit C
MEKEVSDLNLYPEKPGVYLMKDSKDQVIYVGKAKNLKNRLRQYFTQQDNRVMIPYLVSQIKAIETILCLSEKEALLLENTLIKKHKPKYNVLLKDDKSFICLFIDPKSSWPRLELIRSKEQGKKKGIYFGPYSQAHAARETYKILSEHFGLRQCSDYELLRRKRPCLLYGMKKCKAPCLELCTKQDYKEATDSVIKFLQGQSKDILKVIEAKIQKASEALAFEQAGALYKTLKQLEMITHSRQMMVQVSDHDMDIVHIYQEGSRGVCIKLLYRGGKIVGQEVMRFDQCLEEGAHLLTRMLVQHYELHNPAPLIICPVMPEDSEALIDILKETKSLKVSFTVPQKGDKKAFLDLAFENAKLSFEQSQKEEILLLELEQVANLSRYPEVIECFDLSHFSGSEPCAVKIRLEGGKIQKTGKRLFKIKTAKGGDDYGGMKEVLTRSLLQAKEDDSLPDLLLIDGGKGQVNMAKEVLEELDIVCLDIVGLVKDNARHDKGLSQEKLIVSYQEDPLILDKKSPLLFFLQKIRDEAHRAAISFNQKRQKARTIKSALDDIPGIGETKKKALLKHFGSVQKIKEASADQLEACKPLTKKDIETLRAFFLK